QPALRVIAVRGAAGLFVDARGDEHDAGAFEVGVIAVRDLDLGAKWYAVSDIGCDRVRGLARAIDQHDLACAAANRGGHGAGASHIARSDDTEFHSAIQFTTPETSAPAGARTLRWRATFSTPR